jgi:hypothetical protein
VMRVLHVLYAVSGLVAAVAILAAAILSLILWGLLSWLFQV